jgi:hypothetical protein
MSDRSAAAAPFDMPDASHSFEERGGWLVKRLAGDFNLQPFQAAGIVGNLGFESGGFKELQEVGVGSFERGGYGWAQWTGPRRREFEAWCQSQGLVPSSDEANYGYLCVELRGFYHHTITAVSNTSNDADAVFSVGQTYERPAGTTSTFLPGFDGRLKYARRAMAGAGVTPPVPGTLPPKLTAPPLVTDRRILKLTSPMMTGRDVEDLQRRLGIEADGEFGPLTNTAVRNFQVAHDLSADGIVGRRTWEALA